MFNSGEGITTMTPLKWAMVGTAVAAGVVAIGYFAGETSPDAETASKKVDGMDKYIEAMQQMQAMQAMAGGGGGGPGGMPFGPGGGGGGGLGRMPGLGMGPSDSDSESGRGMLDPFGGRVDSDSDDDDSDIDMSSIANYQQSRNNVQNNAQIHQLRQKFKEFVATKKYLEASVVGEKFLSVIEKEVGRNSDIYAISSADVACDALFATNKPRALELLDFAFAVLLPKTAEAPYLVKNFLKMSLIYTNLASDENPKSLEYMEKTYDALNFWVTSEPDNIEAQQYYKLWLSTLMNTYRKLGLWKKVEIIYQKYKSGRELRPETVEHATDDKDVVENYVSSLHQQGKTMEAIQTIQSFMDGVKESSLSDIDVVIEWGFERMSKFYFYLDDFANTEKCIINLRDHNQFHHPDKFGKLSLPLSAFTVLMTAVVELNNDDQFAQYWELLRNEEPDPNFSKFNSFIRSKYFITQEATITTCYTITIKVCIKRPIRPEGEAEKPEKELDRKLTTFFVETFFEDPCGGDDLVSSQAVGHYDFDIVSPVFKGIATTYRWYLSKTYIYSDATKSELIGRHFQPIYLKPNQARRPRFY